MAESIRGYTETALLRTKSAIITRSAATADSRSHKAKIPPWKTAQINYGSPGCRFSKRLPASPVDAILESPLSGETPAFVGILCACIPGKIESHFIPGHFAGIDIKIERLDTCGIACSIKREPPGGRPLEENGSVVGIPLSGKVESIFDAAEAYQKAGQDLVVVAGKLYGSGSSRDWAGKGPALLGVKAVLAESFERIHRSNLVQMGVLPLQFEEGQSAASLGLDGTEHFDIEPVDVSDGLPKSRKTHVVARRENGEKVEFDCVVRVDTPMEGGFLSEGGILPFVLNQLSA